MIYDIPEFVQKIISKFEKGGFEIYIVGGGVRDLLSKRFVDDWDFTTNATPEEILKLYPKAFYDNEFGTVGLSHKSSAYPYEITTFRREYGYSDKRRPDKVEWGKSLEEDLERRDFTINAMALSPSVLSSGSKDLSKDKRKKVELIDPFDGQKDLKAGLIRAVGKPKQRFSEDALRMMRAVRIAAELGFVIEELTFEAIKMNTKLINEIAKERVRDELLKILGSSNPYEGITMLRNSGLMQEILPELEKAFGVEQKSPGRHHIYDVGTHSLLSLKNTKNDAPIVRLAILIHDIGKPATHKLQKNGVITFYNHEVVGARIAKKIAQRLRFSKKQEDKLWRLVRYHQFTVNEHQTDSAIRRFIRNVTKENVADMLDLRVADRLGGGARETSWRLEDFKKRLIEVQKQPFTVHDLKISGNDVMKVLRLRSGPKVGETLEKLYQEVVEKKVPNEKKALLKKLKEAK